MPLLERVGRNVRLTAAAQTLVGAHRRAARAHGGGRGRAARRRRSRSPARCGWRRSSPPACTCSPPRCGGCRRAHPGAARRGHRRRARDVDAERSRSARSTSCSATSTRSSPARPTTRLDLEPLLEEQLPHHAARRAPAGRRAAGRSRSRALRDEPWAIGKDDSHYAELTIRACRALGGFEPDVRHRSNDLLMLLALVANGQAVTLLPDLVRADREPSASSPATSPRRR